MALEPASEDTVTGGETVGFQRNTRNIFGKNSEQAKRPPRIETQIVREDKRRQIPA
jgi:hypothetical protein